MELIFDRTQDDITNDTDKAYIAYTDLNRIEEACKELADILGITIETKTWLITDFRTTSEMERIHDNIQLIQNTYKYKNPYTPALPGKITFSSITQANTIEECIYMVWAMYNGERNLWNKCGYYSLGIGGNF